MFVAPYGIREPTEKIGGSKTEAELHLDPLVKRILFSVLLSFKYKLVLKCQTSEYTCSKTPFERPPF